MKAGVNVIRPRLERRDPQAPVLQRPQHRPAQPERKNEHQHSQLQQKGGGKPQISVGGGEQPAQEPSQESQEPQQPQGDGGIHISIG
jgi:hypothetical protein